ncbi:MAG TPA: hypothetical protein VH396_00435 [Chitinophagaceae bacterium]
MKTKLLITIAAGLCFTACSKDKFTTKPQLEFESVNSNVIGPGQQLIMTLKYTDREGDIQNYIYVQRKLVNDCINDTLGKAQSIPSNVPEKSNAAGEIVIRYSYSPDVTYPLIGEPSCPGNDTCIYRFALADKAGNVSDTIASPTIVILKR